MRTRLQAGITFGSPSPSRTRKVPRQRNGQMDSMRAIKDQVKKPYSRLSPASPDLVPVCGKGEDMIGHNPFWSKPIKVVDFLHGCA